MRTISIIFLTLTLFANTAYAQFGNLLKDKGMQILKKEGMGLLDKELHKTKAKFDSTSFSYAISLSDKAAQFESKDKMADVVNVSTMLVDQNKSKSPLDEAHDYMDIGEMAYAANGFKLAEGSFITANAILLVEGNEQNPLYGRGLANLGLLYNSMGRYSAAEEFTNMALHIREKYRGKESKDYAASLNNLAVLNKDLGNYNKAEKEITQAIQLNKKLLGEESIAYAISLNNRGVLYQTLGRYNDAEKDMQLMLKVAAKSLKSSSLQYTRLQSNLAILYQQQGKYDQAEEIFKTALNAIARNPTKSKKTNPDYAHMTENLASLYVEMGRLDEAEKLYLEALGVYAKKFSVQYSGYGLTSARLGSLYLLEKNLPSAEKYLLSAENILTNTFGETHPYTVDVQVQLGMLFWHQDRIEEADKSFVRALDKSLDFVGKYFAPMSETEKALYWKTIQPRFEKYYAFTASTKNKEITKRALQYRLATKAMLLSGTTKVKNKILQSGDSALIKDYQLWLDQKGTLAHYYAMSKEDLQEQNINLDSINRSANVLEKSLSERSGLFDAAYKTRVPRVNEIQSALAPNENAVELIRIANGNDGKIAYLAIVVTNDKIEKVALENGDDMEGKFYKRYRNLIRFKKEDTFSYGTYFKSINELLANASTVYLSLDGVFNQLSINSLQVASGKYLLDEREFIIVSSLRELKAAKERQSKNSKTAVLIGNPNYGSDAINSLPGTGKEVNLINNILTKSGYATSLEVGDNASEENFKNISNMRLIHVATHGFFVADPKQTGTSVFKIPLYNVNENVLLRSGLLFAGSGKQASEKVNEMSMADNGILTSYEVMNLDLNKTDIVVLSACETGLGDVMAGEGVYGLQRAFMVAGASYVVMSLWKVDDDATQQLMVDFYTNWLRTNNLEKAFREAQKQVKSTYKSPYYWGAFVLLKH